MTNKNLPTIRTKTHKLNPLTSYALNMILLGGIFISQTTSPCYAGGSLDPLSSNEVEQLAILATPPQTRMSKSTRRPLMTLLVERYHDKSDQDARLATVYQYDYELDHTLAKVFDLTTQQLLSQEVLTHTQLPLTVAEHAEIKKTIFADSEQLELIQQTFLRSTGNVLSTTDRLSIKAFVFMGDSLPGQLNPAAERCGEQRCAQVLLYINDATVFEISPIVNLSAGLVVQNLFYD